MLFYICPLTKNDVFLWCILRVYSHSSAAHEAWAKQCFESNRNASMQHAHDMLVVIMFNRFCHLSLACYTYNW